MTVIEAGAICFAAAVVLALGGPRGGGGGGRVQRPRPGTKPPPPPVPPVIKDPLGSGYCPVATSDLPKPARELGVQVNAEEAA